MSYSATILAYPSLVAYWRLGESSGLSAADQSGNGHTGTYTNGVTLGAAGALLGDADTAANFDGVDDYVATTGVNTVIGGASAATIEAWIYRGSTSNLVTLGFNTGGSNNFLFVWFTDGRIYFQIGAFPNAALAGTGWHHVVMAYDGGLAAASRITAYVDGSAVTLTAGGGSPPAALPSTVGLGAFEIGRDLVQSRFTNGLIDEVAVYSAALSSSQVLANYNRGKFGT